MANIEIAPFPGNKNMALTFSWDDGVEEDRPLVKFMNEHGLRGTFNLNSGSLGRPDRPANNKRIDASEVASLYQGHEVAIHTVTHPHLAKLDASQIVREVLEDRVALEDIVGYPVRGMAYPYGTFSQQVIDILRTMGIVYARTTQMANPCFPPAEPLAWAATGHMFSQTPENMAERFKLMHASPGRSNVFFVWGHSYEFERSGDRWNEMHSLFEPMAGHDDVWYCTNIELFDYEAARKRIIIAANQKTAHNPSALPVTLLVNREPFVVPGGQTVSLSSVTG